MPYRRLPNTDTARVRALEKALTRGQVNDINKLPFSPVLRQKIEFFLPKFKTALANAMAIKEKQIQCSKKYSDYMKRARLYISHFLQVLNFTIIRGELKPITRSFYGIPDNSAKLPSLATEADLLEWGEKIIDGERERTGKGGTPIYNPSIALVKVNFDNFKQSYFSQKQFQQTCSRNSAEVARYRSEADTIILSLWNAIEEHYASILDKDKQRSLCEEFGVVYVFRKGEKEKLLQKKEIERITLKLPFK